MFYFHEDKFQVLAGHVFTGRDEVKPVICLLGYVTTSVGRGGACSSHAPEHAVPE